MPDPQITNTIPATSSNATAWLSDIPGGDIPFDDLFTSPSDGGTVTDPATPTTPVTPQADPATTVPAEPFLKAGQSIYKSREEAERSLAYKDELIENLRQVEIRRTGIDPITQKPVPVAPQGPVNYRQNNGKYLEDLVAAVNKQDPTGYFHAQQKMVYDVLEPIAPILADFTRNQAIANVSAEIKDFGNFRGSADYQATLNALPELKAAVELAERDLNFSDRLPQLYKTAYWATQGRKTPDIVQSAVQAATPPNPPARPTTQPATMAPPNQVMAPESLTTSEGRKAILARFGNSLDNVKW